MPKTYTLTITLEGVTRTYKVTEEDIINRDWNANIEDMLDTFAKAKDF